MADAPVTPFHGWKLGELVAVGEAVRLRSGSHGVVMDVEDSAMCIKNLDHEPPVIKCTCGFSAHQRVEPLVLYSRPPFSQLLEVELSGRLLTGRSDTRGELQRVLKVILNPLCYRCQQAASLISARTTNVVYDTKEIAPVQLVTSCERCIEERYWRPQEVADQLDLQLLWAKPEHVLVLLGRQQRRSAH